MLNIFIFEKKWRILMIKLLRYFLLLGTFILTQQTFPQGNIIPTGSSQSDFLKAYKMALDRSNEDYRLNGAVDSLLFPKYGEFSVYWIKSGADKGSFVLPEQIPTAYSSVNGNSYSTYNWQNVEHTSI